MIYFLWILFQGASCMTHAYVCQGNWNSAFQFHFLSRKNFGQNNYIYIGGKTFKNKTDLELPKKVWKQGTRTSQLCPLHIGSVFDTEGEGGKGEHWDFPSFPLPKRSSLPPKEECFPPPPPPKWSPTFHPQSSLYTNKYIVSNLMKIKLRLIPLPIALTSQKLCDLKINTPLPTLPTPKKFLASKLISIIPLWIYTLVWGLV